jgi:hypothetical protein
MMIPQEFHQKAEDKGEFLLYVKDDVQYIKPKHENVQGYKIPISLCQYKDDIIIRIDNTGKSYIIHEQLKISVD